MSGIMRFKRLYIVRDKVEAWEADDPENGTTAVWVGGIRFQVEVTPEQFTKMMFSTEEHIVLTPQ